MGFNFTPRYFEEFTRLNVFARVGVIRGPTLIVAINLYNRDCKDLQALLQAYLKNKTPVNMQERLFWIDANHPRRRLASWLDYKVLFEQTIDWLNGAKG